MRQNLNNSNEFDQKNNHILQLHIASLKRNFAKFSLCIIFKNIIEQHNGYILTVSVVWKIFYQPLLYKMPSEQSLIMVFHGSFFFKVLTVNFYDCS